MVAKHAAVPAKKHTPLPVPPTTSRKLVIPEVEEKKMPPAAAAVVPKKLTPAELAAQTASYAKMGLAADGETPLNPQAGGAKGPKFEVVTTPHGEFRKGTIVHRIYEELTQPLTSALTMDAMVAKLTAEFPETGEKNFRSRLGFHISQFPIKYGASVGRNAAGQLSTQIQGWDGTKVLTAEQVAKRDELLAAKKAKADAKAAKLAEGAGAAEAKAAEKAKKAAEKLEAATKKAADAQAKAEAKAKEAAEKAAKVAADAAAKAAELAKVAAPSGGAVVSVGKLAPAATVKGKK